ncbi:hypothetical protein PV328_001537 [Microctonus aethiopoides]|uniref:Fatty acid desaturase domain-containing protein n=1 Tax=Microctonus aethiopoides TaxID=144406 RepID=A0AA39FX53_9HYME|nr:hypothetical protein PV328_001537 [Microctonus aethiopoides]
MPPNTLSTPLSNGSVHHEDNQISSIKTEIKSQRRWNEFETDIKWGNATFIFVLHSMCLFSIITFPYRQQFFLLLWALITAHMATFAITAGVHRLWTHRSYKAKLPLRIILATLYYSAGMNKIYDWVRDHRIHHKYTDTEADPHDSNRGFWFSHVGWLMMKKKNIVKQRGEGIDMTDILQDPVVQFFDRNYAKLNTLFTFIVPVFIPIFFFNQDVKWTIMSQIFIRYTYILNVTWSVNSFAHIYGYRSYDKSIRSTENVWVALAASGEGWHNYHHVFPWDYQAAELKSFIFNTTKFWIDFFAKIGWAYDLKYATTQHIEKVVETKGDGTHFIHSKSKL